MSKRRGPRNVRLGHWLPGKSKNPKGKLAEVSGLFHEDGSCPTKEAKGKGKHA